MSRLRVISDQTWRCNRLSGCTIEDRYALFYFLTSPFSNVIGAYEIVPRVAASEMGWDLESQLMPVMRRLIDAGMLDFDAQANYIWVKDWWDHNSAKMAVATTLRKKALAQIEALPQGWRDAYVCDFINRLPADDDGNLLRNTVAKALRYGPYSLSIPYAERDDDGLHSADATKNMQRNQSLAERHTLATPYIKGMNREEANTTTNHNRSYIPTTRTTPQRAVQYPSGLVYAEKMSIENLLTDVEPADAQALLDELEGAIRKPGTIKKSKVAYFKALLDRHRTGHFVPAAGISVATKREREAASDGDSSESESTPLSREECRARLQELKAQLDSRTRLPE